MARHHFMDNKGNVVLENMNICLHEDKIRIIAMILPQFSNNMTPINVTDLAEIIADILSQICKEHGFLSIFLTDADYKVTVSNERV